MLRILKENTLFVLCCLLFFISGAILLYSIDKGDIILFFNENRSLESDLFFKYFTRVGEEFSYILIGIISLIIRIRYALMVALTGLSVMLISYAAKRFFNVNRPYTFFKNLGQLEDLNFIEGVYVVKGATSYPSGHTMSGFALYSLVIFFLLPSQKKIWTFPLFIIAFLVGISRVYLVQHFFEDIYFGAFLGISISLIIYWLFINDRFYKNPILDRSLLAKKS